MRIFKIKQIFFNRINKKKLHRIYITVLVLFASLNLDAQNLANYLFSSTTSGSLQNMTGATTLLTGNNDDTGIPVFPIGFDFYFMGVKYTHISANSNGQARLHTNSSATAISGTSITGFSAGNVTLAPMAGDNEVNNGMSALVLGTAPNRKLIIEWNQFYVNFVNIPNSGNMQLVLNETSGVVEYIYGEIYNSSTADQNRSIFISSSNTATSAGYVTIGATPSFTLATAPVTNTILASLPIDNLAGTINGNLRTYTWTPNSTTIPAPPISLTFSAITASTTTLNWEDNSTDETVFVITRATDAGFTQNLNVSYLSSTSTAITGTAYNLPQIGLSPGTMYYYRVQASSEAVIPGTALTGSQSTLSAATYFWVGGASSNWSNSTNWNSSPDGSGSPRTTPETTDALIVDGAGTTPGGPVTINIDGGSYTIGQLVITNNTNLNLQSSTTTNRTISVSGGVGDDFIVDAGSTLSLTNTTQAATIAFTNTGNTGLIDGVLNFGGSTANVLNTTGGTNTIVIISNLGIVNIGTTAMNLVGNVASLNFANGSNCNLTAAITGAPPVPLATWGTTANLTITGVTTSTTAPTNNNQSFGNVFYNCTNATGTMSFWTTTTTAVVKGNLSIQSTGTGKFRATTSGIVTVNGNLNVSGGTFEAASTTGSVNVLGNIFLSGGSLDVAFNGAGNLRTARNFTQTGGTLTQSNVAGVFEFNGNTPQTFSPLTTTGNIAVRINNSTGVNLTSNITLNRLFVSKGNLNGIGVVSFNQTNSSLTYNSTTSNQTITNTEFPFFNSPVSLIINNTFPSGIVTMSFSRTLGGTTGALNLTVGVLDNTGNTITVSNPLASGVIGGSSSSYVKGSVERTLPANLASGSTYVFPVGKSGYNPMELINPQTTGILVIKSEVFDASTGGSTSALFTSLNTNRYWETSFTSGQTNFVATANTAIRLNDIPGTADGIAGSSTLNGVYDLVGGVLITATPTSLTTSAPLSTIPPFMVMATKAAASLTNLSIAPSGNVCVNIPRNVSVLITPGGASITSVVLNYSVNGTTQTPISMINTTNNGGLSADTWTAIIPTVSPQNGNVTWTVSATDNNTLVQTINGTAYQDSTNLGPAVAITPSLNNFCGTGGTAVLTASSTDASMVYTWSALNPATGSLDVTSGTAVNATVTATSDFKVSGTNSNGCVSISYYSLGVYPLPSATVTTSASGVCPGTSATISSGLSAGNFSAICITYSPQSVPANAATLVNNGVAQVPLTSGSLDDGGWGAIPIGFTFNFFGTNYTTLNIGTNSVLQFGIYNAAALGDFTIGALPNTTDPMGAIFAAANDLNCGTTNAGNPTSIKYWTEGYAPNRRFVVQYDVFRFGSTTQRQTIQAVVFETIGTVEMHAIELASVNSKTVGVNNPTGTIGAAASNCAVTPNTTNFWQAQTATLAMGSGQSWRFTPPSNYTTAWTATDANGTTTIANGTNIFTQAVSPIITTDYSISYTNQTTGCTNAPGSAQVNMVIYSDVAPSGVNTIASSTTFCAGQSVNFNLDYTGTTNGITFQWQVSTVAGVWNDITSATNNVFSLSPTQNASYRCKIVACNGTPAFSSEVTVNYANEITSTTAGTICGTGSVNLNAIGSTGSTINWYASEVSTTSLGTGSSFTTPVISETTTYFVAAETFGGTCSSARIPISATSTTAPLITLSNNQAPFCGTGGTATITANSSANYGFTWTVSDPSVQISNQTSTSIEVIVTETTTVSLSAVEVGTGCIANSSIVVSVFPLPTANVVSDVNGVCPGTSAIISTGLSAGNFSSISIPHSPITAPINATTLVNGGIATPANDLGFSLDDGGWSGIPLGFNFNFFGTTYNTITIGTNGTVFFGTNPTVGDFTFNTLPSTTEPFNMVAVLAMDNDLRNASSGAIKYWTEGVAPNRKFVVSYENVQEFNASEFSTAQAIFYETVGEIEVHVTSSTNIDRNKLVGVNNGDGTIGVLAFASGTTVSTNNPIINPFAFRFVPPANYTTIWTATNTFGTTTIASGTNIFTQTVTPSETTVYAVSYTNQTTGCTNAPGSADVTVTILGNIAPTGISILSSNPTVCSGIGFQITSDYAGNQDGLTYQWQVSTDNGQSFSDIVGQTALTITTNQVDTSIYRLAIFSCGGSPSFSNELTIGMSEPTDCYCVPTYTFGCTDGDVIARVVLNTLDNNSGPGCPSGTIGYSDYTSDPVLTTTLIPSTNYICTVYSGDWMGNYAAWIDYNDDGIFDVTERIGFTTTGVPANSSVSFPVNIDCNPQAGQHRLRVREIFATTGANITPCDAASFGEVEDYIITIAPAPTCPSPGLLVSGTTSTSSIDLAWTMGCSIASSFDFEYGPVGFVQGTGTLVQNQTATTNFTLNSLAPNTSYQIYFRANCGNGDVSPWSIPVNGTTLCAPITLVNPGAQIVCDTYPLATISELTPSNNGNLSLSYRTQTNGGGVELTGAITSTQTIHIFASAGSCTANESFSVVVNNSSTSITNDNACLSYNWNGVDYTSSGTYSFTTTNVAGCDSVATLNLIINQPTSITLNELACGSYSLNNQIYTSSGTYVQTLTNSLGCDSTITLNLTIGQPNAITITESACNSYNLNGTNYTQSGVYTQTLTNIFGCDSIVTLNLTINGLSSSNTVLTECNSYLWNGTNYTASGTYIFTSTNLNGCDSIATLVLTIGNNSSTTTASTCGSFTWTNGTIYTESGSYTQTLTNVAGCDSIVTLNLTINPSPIATVIDNGNGTLVASGGSSYQWIDCATNSPISGATSATYTAPINGSYAVIVTNSSNCSATSSCVIVNYLSIDENELSFNVYPNPTIGIIKIVINQSIANYDVTVEDMNGRIVADFGLLINGNGIYTLDLSNVTKGVYFIKFKNDKKLKTARIIVN